MQISYDTKNDLLYLRLDDTRQDVVNRRVADGVVLDIGANNRIIGIEIMDASRRVSMDKILPVEYPSQNRKKQPATVRERSRAYKVK